MSFIKITPINATLGEEVKFIFIDNLIEIDEDLIDVFKAKVSLGYYNGANFEKAEKNDPVFIEYLNKDLKKIQKDINKLLNLKSAIEKELSSI